MTKSRSKNVMNQSEITLLLKDSHLWLGMLMLVAIIFSVAVIFIRISANLPRPINQTKAMIQPTPESQATFQSVLAKTSAEPTQVQVQNGESFWKISQRVCGSGVYYEKIKSDNNYSSDRALKQGEILKVSCS